jgi:(1->4)-alpha-D-glucan 1-alpha-D-glucosylmutase
MRENRVERSLVDGEPAPDRADEYRFYQALTGIWPLDLADDVVEAPEGLIARLCEYMIKAVKEAKVHTSWLTPNQPYEDALVRFVRGTLSGAGAGRLLPSFLPFQRRIAALGMINSLAQLTLKIGSPGIPDFYQGTDLWDLSLVDPDNRRPVDFERRARLLDEVDALLARDALCRAPGISEWLQNWRDGRVKLLVTASGLRMRRAHAELFLSGSYVPLATRTTVPGDLVAFARVADQDGSAGDGAAALFIAPRLCSQLVDADHSLPVGERWKTSRVMLPPALGARTFRHEVTGAEIKPTSAGYESWIFAGEAFAALPLGILAAL